MREYRLGKNTTAHYSSLEELRKAWGKSPIVKRTGDQEKLRQQQERFASKHKCSACGSNMTYVSSSNVMTCTNEKCKGIKLEREDSDGNKIVTYLPSYDLLDNLGAEIANNIFA